MTPPPGIEAVIHQNTISICSKSSKSLVVLLFFGGAAFEEEADKSSFQIFFRIFVPPDMGMESLTSMAGEVRAGRSFFRGGKLQRKVTETSTRPPRQVQESGYAEWNSRPPGF